MDAEQPQTGIGESHNGCAANYPRVKMGGTTMPPAIDTVDVFQNDPGGRR